MVAAAQGGDRAALEALLRRHHQRIYALCHRLTAGSDADDACQEALVAVVRGLPSFDGRSSFSTWAYRVATNACFDELRRRRRQPAPVDTADDEAGNTAWPGTAGRSTDTVEHVAVRLDLDAALGSLPAEFRTALVLRDLCDLSYAEIAAVLDVPVGTVRSRIARGRAALVPLLTGEAGNSAPPPDRPSP